MKIARCVILVIILAVPSFPQSSQPLPAPPNVVGVPFYLDSLAGELKKLASEPYQEHAHYGIKITWNVQTKGTSSALRIPSHNRIVFVYDATTLPRLYKFTVKGSKREFPYERGTSAIRLRSTASPSASQDTRKLPSNSPLTPLWSPANMPLSSAIASTPLGSTTTSRRSRRYCL